MPGEPDFADVRECSPVSKSLVALRIRSLANGGEHAAQDWGSRGRRFKSCHPDGKQQVRGRFGQNPRRPLCCREAIGVATAHVLTSPLLLRVARRQSAPWLARWPCTSPVIPTEECPSSSETVCSGTRPRACAWRVPQRVQVDTAHAQSLGRGADRPQCFPGVDCSPALRGEDEARLNPDRGCLDPLGRLARLDPPKSATVAGERGTLRRKRSVLGSLMTRCPLTRKSVPRPAEGCW